MRMIRCMYDSLQSSTFLNSIVELHKTPEVTQHHPTRTIYISHSWFLTAGGPTWNHLFFFCTTLVFCRVQILQSAANWPCGGRLRLEEGHGRGFDASAPAFEEIHPSAPPEVLVLIGGCRAYMRIPDVEDNMIWMESHNYWAIPSSVYSYKQFGLHGGFKMCQTCFAKTLMRLPAFGNSWIALVLRRPQMQCTITQGWIMNHQVGWEWFDVPHYALRNMILVCSCCNCMKVSWLHNSMGSELATLIKLHGFPSTCGVCHVSANLMKLVYCSY